MAYTPQHWRRSTIDFLGFAEIVMNTIIYVVGLVVVIGLVLSFFGLR